jgi:hypothetical protein
MRVDITSGVSSSEIVSELDLEGTNDLSIRRVDGDGLFLGSLVVWRVVGGSGSSGCTLGISTNGGQRIVTTVALLLRTVHTGVFGVTVASTTLVSIPKLVVHDLVDGGTIWEGALNWGRKSDSVSRDR